MNSSSALDPLMQLIIKEQVSKKYLDEIEVFLDRLFSDLGMDVEFTNHFFDRLNDTRNRKEVTGSEIIRIFKKAHDKYGKELSMKPDDFQGVLKDLSNDLNIPFALNFDPREQDMDIIAKTIMRKHNFRTSNRQFPVV